MQDDELIKDLSTHDYDIVKLNRQRFQALNFSFNQNRATVFVAVGLHFDKKTGMAFPVIAGSDWIERDKVITLLQEAIVSLNTKIIEDAKNPPKV
jgi:hypothetical protein